MKKALIIDDEKNGRDALKSILENFKYDISVIGEAENVNEGLAKIESLNPEVIFLDIEMPDGTGFDLLEKVGKGNFEVIFVTAYDSYAIRAFQFSAIDYLLKPIDPFRLKSSIEKLKENIKLGELNKKLDVLLQNRNKPQKITLPTTEGIHVVRITDIIRCSADDCYTHFILNNGSKIVVSKTLKEYSELLEEVNFLRVHQSHLINIDYIKRFTNTEGGYLVMNNGEQIPVSRRKKKSLLEAINQIR